ncbi:MAG TPA: sugar phosphate isomerase/epimerase family protein [Acidobacteriota bacterium]|nr:sugar phosphate isomerase/epimerase family protein [Acidobacteriota bacterium]
MPPTRRELLLTLPVIASAVRGTAASPAKSWKPKLGILCRYTDANVEFAAAEGFKSLEISATQKSRLDAAVVTDEEIEKVKNNIARTGLVVSALGIAVNHTAPDAAERARINTYVAKVIELAGKMGVPYVATMSGNMPGRRFQEQVDEIVKIYNEKYFALCQQHKVRILWEPWPEGPNIATGPIGYDALFKAFGNSPHIGIQWDASHLVRQFMDPVQCMRDYIDKIYDMHLKDTEIFWPVLRRCGINPPTRTQWWRYRIPGYGEIRWPEIFSVLMDAGYEGSMNIEHEDETYGRPLPDGNFSEEFKTGFKMGLRYLRQYVPA